MAGRGVTSGRDDPSPPDHTEADLMVPLGIELRVGARPWRDVPALHGQDAESGSRTACRDFPRAGG
ncbi:hypothetical protein [Streptomyces sp. NPDC058964]|uniref:hypothetical protein n=1 Tax=Streptomyces sp. NPDC058964 TaxID=3346681 RepID=UPI00368EA223